MRKQHLVNFIVPCLVLNLFLMRPSALGQSFQALSLGIAVVLCALHLILRRPTVLVTTPQAKKEMRWYMTAFFLFWIYEIPLTLIDQSNLDFVTKEFVSALVTFVCYGLVLVQFDENKRFFRFLCTVIALIGASSGITILLGSTIGYERLLLTHISVAGYDGGMLDNGIGTGSLYFPLSMLYSKFTSGSVELMRFNGFFREAGIYQAVACFCIVYEYFTRRSKLVMIGAAVGVIAAFSSLGILLLIMIFGAIIIMRIRGFLLKLVLVSVLAIAAYPVALYVPYIGLEAKQGTHSTSITDRTEAMGNVWGVLSEHPLGSGLFNGQQANSGITLIAATGQLGIIGFLLQVFMLSGWRVQRGRAELLKIMMCAPLLITALISQPIAGSPIMYVLPMISMISPSRKKLENQPNETRLRTLKKPLQTRT